VGAFCSMKFCRFSSAQNSGGIVACMELTFAEDLRLGMRADDQRGGDVGRRRELERSRSQIGAELSRHSAQPLSLLDVLVGMFQDVLP
jgi:hypothetical protein